MNAHTPRFSCRSGAPFLHLTVIISNQETERVGEEDLELLSEKRARMAVVTAI